MLNRALKYANYILLLFMCHRGVHKGNELPSFFSKVIESFTKFALLELIAQEAGSRKPNQ